MAVPDAVWSPMATGGLVLAVGVLGLMFGKPWLFPSLAPTAFLQLQSPRHPSSRPYDTVVGHLIGLADGWLATWAPGAYEEPGVLASQELTWPRLGAAALAMVVTMLGTLLARAAHPPAAATALLIAEGSYKLRAEDLLLVCIGVGLTAALGEGLRQVRLRWLTPPPEPG